MNAIKPESSVYNYITNIQIYNFKQKYLSTHI